MRERKSGKDIGGKRGGGRVQPHEYSAEKTVRFQDRLNESKLPHFVSLVGKAFIHMQARTVAIANPTLITIPCFRTCQIIIIA
eukprot:1322045-Amorphochlora_amoeboformis.AAC.1